MTEGSLRIPAIHLDCLATGRLLQEGLAIRVARVRVVSSDGGAACQGNGLTFYSLKGTGIMSARDLGRRLASGLTRAWPSNRFRKAEL